MELSEAFSSVRALSHGIAAFKRAPLSMLVGGFIMFCVAICSGGGGGGGGDLEKATKDLPPEASLALAMMFLALFAVGIVLGLVAFVVRCWLLPGWIRLQAHVLEHGTENLPLLFGGADAMLRMLGWRVLQGFIRFGTLLVALLPGGIVAAVGFSRGGADDALVALGVVLAAFVAAPVFVYVDVGLRLGDLAVTLDRLGPIDALDRSWDLARGNRVRLWLFFLITDFFGFLGYLFCIVGGFFTTAVADVATTEAYCLATKPEAANWAIPRGEGG